MRKRFYHREFTPLAFIIIERGNRCWSSAMQDKRTSTQDNSTKNFSLGWFEVSRGSLPAIRFLLRRSDLEIEVFRLFPRSAKVKKSRDRCVGVGFAVWGLRRLDPVLEVSDFNTVRFFAPLNITIPLLRKKYYFYSQTKWSTPQDYITEWIIWLLHSLGFKNVIISWLLENWIH